MTDVIHISWSSGFMDVVVERFFPADLVKTRKVFKLLLQDPDWTDDKIDELLNYLRDRQRKTEKRAAELQFEADLQKAVVDALKAKMPKRNDPRYTEYVKEKEKAYQMGVAARFAARTAKSLKRTWLLLWKMDGRTI